MYEGIAAPHGVGHGVDAAEVDGGEAEPVEGSGIGGYFGEPLGFTLRERSNGRSDGVAGVQQLGDAVQSDVSVGSRDANG